LLLSHKPADTKLKRLKGLLLKEKARPRPDRKLQVLRDDGKG
jgi:hypothetical protein